MYERPSSRRTWAKFQALLTICWVSLLMKLSVPFAFGVLRFSALVGFAVNAAIGLCSFLANAF